PANTSLLFSEFTPDNRLMAYSVIDWTAQGWQLFIIELATGNTVIFAGAITFSETNGLVGGVAPLGWGADSKTLYLVGVSLDGLATPPFAVDLGNLNFAVDGTNGLPEPKPLLSPEQLGFPFYFVFSPDHTKLAYVYADTTHPVDGYMGRGEPINTIGIVDLATGAARKVVEAPTDHTVENVVWSVDGGAVLYTASSWRADRAGQPFNPQLYAHVLATETSTSPIDFTANDEAYVGFLMPCEKTLYFAVTDPPTIEGSTGITTLYSAPLSNPTEWSAPLLSGYILISRVACVGN
ncbi:MAG TPA: hypothetical protein PLD47_01355, partial [Aggregatilineales bacterium]|nr:hypothetical protein [Aggregatilineales bacterium]